MGQFFVLISYYIVEIYFLQSLYALYKKFKGRETLEYIFKCLYKINL